MQIQRIKYIFQITCLLSTIVSYGLQNNYSKKTLIETDTTHIKLDKELEYSSKNNDTLEIIKTRLKRINFYSQKGFYSKSYDEVWESLPLVTSPKFITQHIEILNKLITLYIIFEQKEKAYEIHKKAIQLVKSNNLSENDKSQLLARLYNLAAWIEIRLALDYSKAEKLALKSIEYYKKVNSTIPAYSKIQLAHIYVRKQDLKKAKDILFTLKKEFPMPLKKTHALLFERIGQYYDIKKERDSAIYYFKTSLEAINKFENHPDKKLQVSKKLSENYLATGNYKLAYKYLLLANNVNDQIFSTNKSQNKELFEIKNKHEILLKENKEAIKSQQIELLENEKRFWLLKILLIIILLSSLFGFLIFHFKRKNRIKILKHNLINQKQKLEIEKQDEILELKNKELLTSALQLLERDTLQQELKTQLNELKVQGENITKVKNIKSILNISTSNKWKEFQSHFTQVNDRFYYSLKEKHTLLTPTDLKMCAFIKLGFSSKDMSQIMGITVEGINTSRSRLRKKMKLTRKTILSEYLQDFS